jgi:hypothetical protein
MIKHAIKVEVVNLNPVSFIYFTFQLNILRFESYSLKGSLSMRVLK